MKSKVYYPQPHNLEALEARIRNVLADQDPEVIRRGMVDDLARRCALVRAANGGYIEF